jgi:hypothetical protein
MRLHLSSRRAASAALGIFLLVLSGTATVAGAAPSPDGRGRESAAGQAKKAPAPAPSPTPSAGTPTAADHPEGYSSHDATNGPGGQKCDGDPSGKSDGGGGANGGGENYDNTCSTSGASQNGAGDGQASGKPCAGCVGDADDKNPPGQYPSGPEDHNNGYECDQKGRSAKEGNNGIGYGNPAHTGCAGAVTPPPPPPPATCPDGKPMPSGGAKDCGVKTCPDGSAMPSSGDTKDCGVKTCPDGSAMPSSGDTKDCGVKTCPDGSAMPSSGDTKDCGVKTCPDGSAMPASGDPSHCGIVPTEVLGLSVERSTEVLGVQLSAPPATPPAVAAAGLARTGLQFGGLVQLAMLLGLAGVGLTVGSRRRLDGGAVDIDERLRNY